MKFVRYRDLQQALNEAREISGRVDGAITAAKLAAITAVGFVARQLFRQALETAPEGTELKEKARDRLAALERRQSQVD